MAKKPASKTARANKSLITKYGQKDTVSFPASAFDVLRTSTPVGLLFPVVWNAHI